MRTLDPELVGPGEVADLLGVKRGTIRQWRLRGLMPEPAMSFQAGSGKGTILPVWYAADIVKWHQERVA